MPRATPPLPIQQADQQQLRQWISAFGTPRQVAMRSQIVLAAAALERWRESGIAPDRLIASRVRDNRVNMTRPLCPYPQVAHYAGVGSTNDAANFACKVP